MKEKVMNKRDEGDSDIDITPMLDVVFIMLIFFVVTASFVKEEAIGLNLPAKESNENWQKKSIVLNIDANNRVSIDGRTLDLRAVESMIVRLKAEQPEASVSVVVDGKANTKTVIGAIDGIRSADVMYPSVSVKAS